MLLQRSRCGDLVVSDTIETMSGNVSALSAFVDTTGNLVLNGELVVLGNMTIRGLVSHLQTNDWTQSVKLQVDGCLYITETGSIDVKGRSNFSTFENGFHPSPSTRVPQIASYGGSAASSICLGKKVDVEQETAPLTTALSHRAPKNQLLDHLSYRPRESKTRETRAPPLCTNPTYGDFRYPQALGSACFQGSIAKGGGMVWLRVRELIHNGLIRADADDPSCASGGTVLIEFLGNHGAMSGNGTISADASPNSGGSGGRIAIVNHRTLTFSLGSISTLGGYIQPNSAPGTLFIEPVCNNAVSCERGSLIVASKQQTAKYPTIIPPGDYLIDNLLVSFAMVNLSHGPLHTQPSSLRVAGACELTDGAAIGGFECETTILPPSPPSGSGSGSGSDHSASSDSRPDSDSKSDESQWIIITSVLLCIILVLALLALGIVWRRYKVAQVPDGYSALPEQSVVDSQYDFVTASGKRLNPVFGPMPQQPSPNSSSMHDSMAESMKRLPLSSAGNLAPAQQSSLLSVQDIMTHSWRLDYDELEIIHPPVAKGGYGIVNRAIHHDTIVAVKTFFEHTGEAALEEFTREIVTLARLRHPNIVLFMGACTDPLCIVTEYVARGSLCDVIRKEPNLITWSRILNISLGTCRALIYLHNQKPPILHRDLKSGNILITNDWTPKIADFGLSRPMSSGYMTQHIGTTRWTAPEVLAEEHYSTKADVYSFGMVLWEMIAKELPFKTLMLDRQIEELILQGDRPEIPSYCPAAFGSLLEQCWSQDPEMRPPFTVIKDQLVTFLAYVPLSTDS